MTKTETIKDSVTAQLIASAISLNNCAISESKNNKGRNTATVVIVEAAIAPHTSRVPSMDAAMGDFPRCKCEKIFFEDNDRIIDEHTYGKAYSGKRYNVNITSQHEHSKKSTYR